MSTIVPLTPEDEWLSGLCHLQPWTLPLVPTCIVAPHPDDETLGVGGMIAKLRLHDIPVTVVAVSDGENAYPDERGLGKVRKREQNEALERLGVGEQSIRRLRLPDSGLAKWEGSLERSLSEHVSPGMHLVAPWPRDFHPDHEACGRAAARVAKNHGLKLAFYLFWTWHRGVPHMLEGLPLVSLQLTQEERRLKLFALEAHVSQFEHAGGAPILSPELLRPAEREFEVYVIS
ncbi:PIG-L deacetylase family protein [Tunturiibacter psychrotolerans]|uniref:PIG-L deacetylase family protein n=1 Tax=Tunturiibacter psychrotolerans TaxID=3069686 RepID=UPI003D26208E